MEDEGSVGEEDSGEEEEYVEEGSVVSRVEEGPVASRVEEVVAGEDRLG